MQKNSFNHEDELDNNINMTPMIDVMLVLLIIFIITLPVINQVAKVSLPKANIKPLLQQEKNIAVSVTASGQILWDKIPADEQQLGRFIAAAAAQQPAPVIRIYADKDARYERIAWLLAHIQQAGLSKIDFVTQAISGKQ